MHEAVAYHGAALAAHRGIFLGQANALTGPRRWREDILRTVNASFQFAATDANASPSWWTGSAAANGGSGLVHRRVYRQSYHG